MSSDTRWSGGLMNRGWNQGTPVKPRSERDELAAQVAVYLADCRRFRRILAASNHPTVDGALMVIFHSKSQEGTIRTLFNEAMAAARREEAA